MPLFYVDASAIVKIVVDEPESQALRAFIDGADLVSCELILAVRPSVGSTPQREIARPQGRRCSVLGGLRVETRLAPVRPAIGPRVVA